MPSERVEEIYETVLPEMRRLGIEDTTVNRLEFLTGLRDGWAEDKEDSNIEKTFYMLAINGEIFSLKLKLMFPRIMAS